VQVIEYEEEDVGVFLVSADLVAIRVKRRQVPDDLVQ
jgi:hypothetical protein